MTTDLYLIRHGESVANVEPIIGGMNGDAGLTERGREQAHLLELRLGVERLEAQWLYASTLPRAVQTAQYVARALRLSVQADDALQELRPGDADGLSVDDWRTRYPGWDGESFATPFQTFAPGGESWAGFLARAGAALTRLVTQHRDTTVVAVTHGGVVEASFYLSFGLGATGNRVGFTPGNTSITHWQHHGRSASGPEWTLVTFNDIEHLADHETGAPSRDAVPTPAGDD
jgi:broad specificity phosphatase PhoE